jgi:LmbE family N-acetylglucosaminyl deacetylase
MVKALVIVAHPDDETIWCGGTILKHKKWDWAIISLCRRDDPDRAPKFARACKSLNARCAMSGLEDEHPEQPLASLGEVKSRIAALLGQNNFGFCFDFIFTHGPNGEYGHNRHKETHAAVKEMLSEGALRCKKIFFFSYKRSALGDFAEPDARGANLNARLSARGARAKQLLITSIYGFSIGSFEQLSASAVESFKVEVTCDR